MPVIVKEIRPNQILVQAMQLAMDGYIKWTIKCLSLEMIMKHFNVKSTIKDFMMWKNTFISQVSSS